MIARLMGEGQYRIDDGLRDRLNELDDRAVSAIDAEDEPTLDAVLDDMWGLVREQGERLPDDDLSPSDVVTYRAPSGAERTPRSRPNRSSNSAGSTTSVTRSPASSRRNNNNFCPRSATTASAPFSRPHCEPETNAAPDGASVADSPDVHKGGTASGNRWRSVIGTSSS